MNFAAEGKALSIPILVENQEISALFDTGSHINCISLKTFRKLTTPQVLRKSELQLRTANGSQLIVHGAATVTISIDALEFQVPFIVTENLACPLILGTSFLADNQIIIDYERCAIVLKDQRTVKFLVNSIANVLPIIDDPVTLNGQSIPPPSSQSSSPSDHVSSPTSSLDFSAALSPELTNEQRTKALALLNEFSDIFAKHDLDIQFIDLPPCKISLKDKIPVYVKPYRSSPKMRNDVNTHVQGLIKAGIVEPCKSAYGAPVFTVPKKQNKSRFVVDYRELNKKVVNDKFPLPRIDNILQSLENKQFFSTMDMNNGFFQVKVDSNDRHILAFNTQFGTFTFCSLPQGFKNSPPEFQRTQNTIFADLLYKSVVIYIDDVCCFSSSFDQHLAHMREIFSRFRQFRVKLKLEKCKFFAIEIDLLGHHITRTGFQPLEKNISVIKNHPVPSTITGIRSFIGLCSYFRKYIKNFAKHALPLTSLLKGSPEKKQAVILNEEALASFEFLKKCLISAPVLAHFSDDRETFLTTDCSCKAMGFMLEQKDESGNFHPIGFGSKNLNDAQSKYSAIEMELLAIVTGIENFREYLYFRPFIVFSDHKALESFRTLKSPSCRIAKFTAKILDYDFTIVYKPGKANLVADHLSREVNFIQSVDDSFVIEQSKDEFCSNLIKALNNKKNVSDKFKKLSRRFTLNDDKILCLKQLKNNLVEKLVVVPKSQSQSVIQSYHDSLTSGHFGIKKTILKIQSKYYWDTLSKDVTDYIKKCKLCQFNKRQNCNQGLAKPIEITTGLPFNRITIDFTGPFSPSERKQFILVGTCASTKFVVTKAYTKANAESAANFLLEIITRFGTPKFLHSDRGSHFDNCIIQNICKKFNIVHLLSTSYHPESQAYTERTNQTIKQCLTNYMSENHSNWSYLLPFVTFSINTTPHSRLKYAPFYLLHGYMPNLPIDNKILPEISSLNIVKSMEALQKVRNDIPRLITSIQEKDKYYYDKKHKSVEFLPNQLVLLKNPPSVFKKTFQPKFTGPFKIIRKISEVNYEVEILNNNVATLETFHVRRLKPFLY